VNVPALFIAGDRDPVVRIPWHGPAHRRSSEAYPPIAQLDHVARLQPALIDFLRGLPPW